MLELIAKLIEAQYDFRYYGIEHELYCNEVKVWIAASDGAMMATQCGSGVEVTVDEAMEWIRETD